MNSNELHLSYFRKKLGDMFPSSSEEALNMSILSYDTAECIGTFDPAYKSFIEAALTYEKIALYLERASNE